jgi:transcriptional regulator with XRE-family HTH domain
MAPATNPHPLRSYRAETGLSLEQLAGRFGVNKTTVMRWEDGRVPAERVVEIETATGIARDPTAARPLSFTAGSSVMHVEPAYPLHFPILAAYSPEGHEARPMNPPSAGGRRREVPRITNVADPRRPFFLSFLPDRVRTPAVGAAVRLPAPGRKIERAHSFCLPGDLISSPAQIARNLKPLSSAHHRLRFRMHGTTGTFEDVQKDVAKEANV